MPTNHKKNSIYVSWHVIGLLDNKIWDFWQIERIRKRQIICCWNDHVPPTKAKKHCGKKRNCWFKGINVWHSLVLSLISKAIYNISMSHALWKKGINAIAKSIDSCQPAQSAQADMGRNFSQPCQRTILDHDSVSCLTNWILTDQ